MGASRCKGTRKEPRRVVQRHAAGFLLCVGPADSGRPPRRPASSLRAGRHPRQASPPWRGGTVCIRANFTNGDAPTATVMLKPPPILGIRRRSPTNGDAIAPGKTRKTRKTGNLGGGNGLVRSLTRRARRPERQAATGRSDAMVPVSTAPVRALRSDCQCQGSRRCNSVALISPETIRSSTSRR